MDAANGVRQAFKKKEDTHKMAEAKQGICPLQVVGIIPARKKYFENC